MILPTQTNVTSLYLAYTLLLTNDNIDTEGGSMQVYSFSSDKAEKLPIFV